jgi:hypothetical protein
MRPDLEALSAEEVSEKTRGMLDAAEKAAALSITNFRRFIGPRSFGFL